MRICIVIVMAIIFSYSYGQTVKIDSAYVYFSQDTNCNTYLVSKHRIAYNCNIVDTLIERSNDSIVVRLCYTMGMATITCPRRDTICLGNLSFGIYNLKLVVSAGFTNSCDNPYRSDSVYRTFSISPTSIESITSNAISISPNPVVNYLNCELQQAKGSYSIYSIAGTQVVQSIAIQSTNFNVDVSTLPSGIYYMAVQDDKQHYIKKFVKQ